MALGLCMGPKTYLSEAWNYLDFFIVIVGLLDFVPTPDPTLNDVAVQSTGTQKGGGVGDISSLRTLRVLRPLRAITKFPKLRFLVVLLFQCVPMLANVMGLCIFIFFVFGILGVQLVQGVLRGRCFSWVDGSSLDYICSIGGGGAVSCPMGYTCLTLAENPGRGSINFDSIGGAMVTIFVVMTMEGWSEIMYWIQDAYSDWMFLYFVVLIFVGPIFAIQLFLVVISNKYAQTEESLKGLEVHVRDGEANQGPGLKDPTSGNSLERAPIGNRKSKEKSLEQSSVSSVVSESVGSFVRTASMKLLSLSDGASGKKSKDKVKPDKKQIRTKGNVDGWRNILWQTRSLAYSGGLSNFILGVIVLNFAFMAMDFDCDVCTRGKGMAFDCAYYKATLEISNIFFAFIFLMEMIIKLLGMGLQKYFTNKMNMFDAFIVIISLVEVRPIIDVFKCYLTAEGSQSSYDLTCALDGCPEQGGSNLTVLRTFRLVRIVKLLRAFPDVQKQIKIVISVLGSVAALNGLILILILIFCILGMNIFGGGLHDDFDARAMGLGAIVYIHIPWDPHADKRYGVVEDMDWVNHTLAPWLVRVRYGTEQGVGDVLDLHDGMIWVAEPDFAGQGVPYIQSIVPRLHFDDIAHAIVTTFEILTISNWNDGLYVAAGSKGAAAGLYFYAIISVGNWMLLNLFIAILIQGFAEQKAEQLRENLLKMQEELLKKLGGLGEDDLANKIEALFESMDKDGSGVIDKFELRDALEQLEITLRPKELQDLVRKYDTDSSGTIDFEEFLSMIKELVKKAEEAVAQGGPLGETKDTSKALAKLDEKEIAKAKQLHNAKQDASNRSRKVSSVHHLQFALLQPFPLVLLSMPCIPCRICVSTGSRVRPVDTRGALGLYNTNSG